MSERLPAYYVSHGGGPWPWMPELAGPLRELSASLADIPRQLGREPRAVLLITAHWEAAAFTLSTHPSPRPLVCRWRWMHNAALTMARLCRWR